MSSLIHFEADRGDEEALQKILDASKALARAKTPSGFTPLHLAAQTPHTALVEKILQQPGVDVNAKNVAEDTPLHLACSRGFQQQVSILLAAKANPNIQNTLGQTALHRAVRTNSLDCVNLLISSEQTNGIAINREVKDKMGKDAMAYVADPEKNEAMKKALEPPPPPEPEPEPEVDPKKKGAKKK